MMVAPTTRLQEPHWFIINNGTKDLKYPIALNRNKVRQWRKTKVRIQPGEGELIKHWDSFHAGMGYSRDESRDAPYAPPVYESGDANVSRLGFIYPRLKQTTITLTGSPVSVDRLAEMGLYIYAFSTIAGAELRIHKVRASDDAVRNEKSTGYGGPAGQSTEFVYLYVPTSIAGSGRYFLELTTIRADTTDDTWTPGPITRYAHHLGTAGKLLWRVGVNNWTVNSCAAISTGGAGGPLTAGNWSDPADYVIGKPGRNINSIAELGRWPYFGKEEGLFGADTEGNQSNALDFSRNFITSTNCNDTIRWLGTLVTTHRSALWQHTGVASRKIGIETLKGNNSALKGGRYTALACATDWLYVAYLVGTTTYLLVARPGDEDEPPIVWHELASLANTTINAMLVSGLTTNAKLWIAATVSGAGSLSYFILAKDGLPDPTDSGVSFEAQAATLDLPAVDWGTPGTPKRGHMVEVVTSQATGTGGTVKVYYGWDGATPSTQLGAAITTAGRTQRFWTAGTTDSGYRPQIRIENTGHASNNLRVEKVSLYCAALPRKEPVITTVVRCADGLDRVRDAKTMYDDLEALENAGVYTVRDPDDPAGGTFKAIVENVDEHKGEQIADVSGERLIAVTMRVVEYA